MKKLLLGTIVTASFAAAAVPLAFADRDGYRGEGPQRGYHAHWHKDGERALPSERVESRLSRLKSELKITEAQEAHWNNFADTLRKQAKEADQRIEKFRTARAENKERPRLNTVERLERQQVRMAERSARMAETLAAMKPLYAALTPEQQKVFDEQRGPRGRHGEHHHRHGEHERGETAAS